MARLPGPKDPCPCGSGRIGRKCCWAGPGRFVCRPVHARTPGQTHYSHPECYAAPLADCSPTISREHWISKRLLQLLSGGGPIVVENQPWQPVGQTKTIGIEAFCDKILCSRHNSALSPLDDVGVDLSFSHAGGQTRQWPCLLNGDGFERWLLKMLCGVVCSARVTTAGGQALGAADVDRWLPLLFGHQEFPGEWGLYLTVMPGQELLAEGGLRWAYLRPEGRLVGVTISIRGIWFTLNLSPVFDLTRELLLEQSRYRPGAVSIVHGRDEKTIIFGWTAPGDHPIVSFSARLKEEA